MFYKFIKHKLSLTSLVVIVKLSVVIYNVIRNTKYHNAVIFNRYCEITMNF